MALPANFTDLLVELAGGPNRRTKLASALGRSYWEVAYWSRKNVIPEECWNDVIQLAARKQIKGVTYEYLCTLQQRKREAESGKS